jgi:hypothetical protein
MCVLDSSSMMREGSGWLQLAMRHLRPTFFPPLVRVLGMPEHHQLASIANTSSHHSHTTSIFLSQALDFGPFEKSNSNTPASLQHFLTSHINSFKSPIPQRPTHQGAHPILPLSTTEDPQKPNPESCPHHYPSIYRQTPQPLASALQLTSRAGKPA